MRRSPRSICRVPPACWPTSGVPLPTFDAARTAPAPQRAPPQRMARRLQALAMENKRLLERAIAVQGRVIGVIARAATAATAPAGYGPARGRRPAAMAFVARA